MLFTIENNSQIYREIVHGKMRKSYIFLRVIVVSSKINQYLT